MRWFLAWSGSSHKDAPETVRASRLRAGTAAYGLEPDQALPVYRAARPGTTPGDLLARWPRTGSTGSPRLRLRLAAGRDRRHHMRPARYEGDGGGVRPPARSGWSGTWDSCGWSRRRGTRFGCCGNLCRRRLAGEYLVDLLLLPCVAMKLFPVGNHVRELDRTCELEWRRSVREGGFELPEWHKTAHAQMISYSFGSSLVTSWSE
ncbi:hypothetical protein Shyhy02_63840 [Streptomyces hygroscopicus subsp. hygroscopicus]|nr:hypothetical protein Shyhy02_63840 [Streptomyces hygroscopicus subsp. hygroscopicus]